jgi:hypothetical protein
VGAVGLIDIWQTEGIPRSLREMVTTASEMKRVAKSQAGSYVAIDRRRHTGPEPPRLGLGGLRFAFYGRISTQEYQDPVSSRAWQVEAAGRVIAGRGQMTAEFFDVGTSRNLPWARRPQAAALLTAAEDPDRGFDAVVIGEFERAFASGEAQVVIALLATFGIQVWLRSAPCLFSRRPRSLPTVRPRTGVCDLPGSLRGPPPRVTGTAARRSGGRVGTGHHSVSGVDGG